jgi:hypothetical protein
VVLAVADRGGERRDWCADVGFVGGRPGATPQPWASRRHTLHAAPGSILVVNTRQQRGASSLACNCLSVKRELPQKNASVAWQKR